MTETLHNYWTYLKHPQFKRPKKELNNKWKDLGSLLLLNLSFATLVILFIYLLEKLNLISIPEGYDFLKHDFLIAFMLVTLVAPLIEELIFRWHLIKPKASLYFISLSSLIIVQIMTKDLVVQFLIWICISVIAIISYYYVSKLKLKSQYRIFKNYYIFLFYYTAIIFGFAHLSNFQTLNLTNPSFLIFISSQTFSGLSLGYIRIRHGLKYSMLLHAMFNGIVFLLAFYLQ